MRDETDKSASEFGQIARQIDGFHTTAVIYAAIRTGVLDRLGSGPRRARSLAEELGVSASNLERLLRAASAIGLCDEEPAGSYRLSANGEALRSGSPSPLREKAILAVEQYWGAWADLAYSVASGQTAFERLHGMPSWRWRRENAAAGARFSAWLDKETRAVARAITASLDLAGAHRVADIGGGMGALLAAILARDPASTGVLFERAEVIEAARNQPFEPGVSGRLEMVAGDFFVGIPVSADVFLLKSILHDWSDDQATSILENCRSAMDARSRLVVIERVLPDKGVDDIATVMLDLHMMVVTGGRERSMTGIAGLLGRAGFGPPSAVRWAEGFALIEARPR